MNKLIISLAAAILSLPVAVLSFVRYCPNSFRHFLMPFREEYARHWGTYAHPLDKMRKQFSSMAEVTYLPQWAKGWSLSAALGLDRGNYLGNSTGGMITLRKTGGFGK